MRKHAPDSVIVLMECAAVPLTREQSDHLDAAVDMIVDWTDDPDVAAIYCSDNWDVVKSTTEIMCFSRTLSMLLEDGDLSDIDRVHKLSGRYQLNDDFNLERYQTLQDQVVISPKHRSQFPYELTGISLQYMSRLWSWPVAQTKSVINVYDQGLDYIAERVSQGGYADIEHILYKFLEPSSITEISPIGVQGAISPNGAAVRE